MSAFPHLFCCSHYSFLRGVCSPTELAQAAAAQGAEAVSLTDYRGLYAAVPFQTAAKSAQIRPIFGASFPTPTPGGALVALARDLKGYANLCRLITADQLARPKSRLAERNAEAWVEAAAEEQEYHPDLIAATQQHDVPKGDLADQAIVCGEGLVFLVSDPDYLRRMRAGLDRDSLFAEYFLADSRQSRQLVRTLSDLAGRLGLRGVATNRVHFLEPDDYRVHRLLCAMRTLRTVETLTDEDHMPSTCWLASGEEMARRFEELPDAIRAAHDVADMCRAELPMGQRLIPRFQPDSGQSPDAFLRALCQEGISRLYSVGERSAARARAEYELDVICSLGYAPYFLIVWDLVRFAREAGIPATGRGSAADSIVCYLLQMTHVDPIKNNLYFERFLSRERTNMPDIDIDFCWRRRDEVLRYVYERWGNANVAMISVHNTFAQRSCVREVGKALGLSEAEVNQYSRHLPYYEHVDYEEMGKKSPESRRLDLQSEPLRSIIPYAKRIEGFPSHMGLHASGILVAPGALTQWVPLERSTKGLVVTQPDMYPIEDMGLVKIDLLGQRSLSVIADVTRQVREERDPEFGFDKVNPEADVATQDRIAAGRTMGVFQIESPGMRGILRRVQARDFSTVTAASSVIRPGPKDSGMLRSWVRRSRGMEPVSFLHPRLRDILSETHGIMIYQEDVLKVAQAIAGFTLGRADIMRRSMVGKRTPESLLSMEKEFLAGAERNGVAPETARQIWKQVQAFGGYAFCKAHSASYTVLSFQSAYLKEHYPAEFMAAVLANGGGYYDRAAYVSEARRMGLRLLLPSINASEELWTGAVNWIRCGLDQVHGLQTRSIKAIVSEREHGAYRSLPDALARLPHVEKTEWSNLILCGACDEFGQTRPQLLWMLDVWFRKRAERAPEQPDFLAMGEAVEAGGEIREAPNLPELPFERLYDEEARALEAPIRCHPLQRFAALMPKDKSKILAARDLPAQAGRRAQLVGWLVTSRRPRTSKGDWMKFLSLEDETDTFEAILFSKAYEKFGHLTLTRGPYLVEGKVDDQEGYSSLHVDRLEVLGRGG